MLERRECIPSYPEENRILMNYICTSLQVYSQYIWTLCPYVYIKRIYRISISLYGNTYRIYQCVRYNPLQSLSGEHCGKFAKLFSANFYHANEFCRKFAATLRQTSVALFKWLEEVSENMLW